jgi:hypothetical protein
VPFWRWLASGLVLSNSLALDGSGSVVVNPGLGRFTNSPTIGSFSLNGANVVMSCDNGQSGAAYYLLTSTNMARPISQWRTVATNVLNANGVFTFIVTSAVTAGNQQQFYLLSNTNYNH